MLGKIGQPWVLEILNLLHRLRIPESERQSANVLKCEDAAKQALLLIQGVEDDWDDPTNQVHIIIKLHRVMTPQETLDGWECGNKYDWAFLRTRMYTKNWKNFPLPLAFNLKTLYTHMESDIVTRRSVAGHRSQREWAPRGSLPQQPVLQYKEVPCERNHADHLQGVQICLEAAAGHP